jgi:hypothetical protein
LKLKKEVAAHNHIMSNSLCYLHITRHATI